MVGKLIKKGKDLLFSPQKSVLSAASVIMLMIVASRVLGLVRQRTLAHFFSPSELSLFFAAFRLPDMIFEVLVFGTFSSSFIPVFAKLVKKDKQEAWDVAGSVVNIGLIIFIILSLIIGFGAGQIYKVFAPGFNSIEQSKIVELTRLLFFAQGFFVVSYVLTGVLESLKRFLVPALAPLFYNIGIILGTYFFSSKYHLMAPVIGVVSGAFLHFMIQLPLATKLGFRFKLRINLNDQVRKIGRLAAPRIFEVSFIQLSKMAELFFASLISTASYTYYTFGNTLQLLPIGLFGTSIAKASLPTLSNESDNMPEFKKIFNQSLRDVVFLTLPIATMLVVLRIPVVRLVFGTDIFSWDATVQTGMVVSAFAVGVVFQTAISLLARSFYALHDTKTPVSVSVTTILITILADYVFIRVFNLPVWGLAIAFSIGGIIQATALMVLLRKKIGEVPSKKTVKSFIKSGTASIVSGAIMFVILKFFDKSVWVKQLGFLGNIEPVKNLLFENFVLDTRYTLNLLILTAVVSLIGIIVYIGLSFLFKSEELIRLFGVVRRIATKKKVGFPAKEVEMVSPTTSDTTTSD